MMAKGSVWLVVPVIIGLLFTAYLLYETFAPGAAKLPANFIEEKGVDALAEFYHIPGFSYAVLSRGEVVEVVSGGVPYVGSKEKLTLKSRFHIGSNTKAFTAWIAAELVEAGLLQWDTPFHQLFPEWKESARSEYHSITLQQLLSHRAHIPAFTSALEISGMPKFTGTAFEQRQQFGKYVLTRKPAKQEFTYSNAGYTLAALMLEKVSGLTWEELAEKTAEKMGIEVGFSWPNLADAAQPWGHSVKWGKVKGNPPQDTYKLPSIIAPAGDLNMSILDYSAFIQRIMLGIKGEDPLLRQSTYEYLMFGLPEYAMGWGNFTEGGLHIASHDGSGGTYYAHAIYVKEWDFAILILTNAPDGPDVLAFYSELQNYLLRKHQLI